MTPALRARAPGGDDGQVMVLAIAFAVIALALVTAVASAGAVHLERKRLLALADQTALAAAVALDEDRYYHRQEGALVLLDADGVRRAATEHLVASAPRLHSLRLADVRTDGRTAEVTLTAVARPPLLSWATAAWSDGVPLRATGRARAG